MLRAPHAFALLGPALLGALPGCSLLGLFDAPAELACNVDDDCTSLGSPDPCLRPFCDAARAACDFRYRDADLDGDGDGRCAELDAIGTVGDCADDDPLTSSLATEACDGADQDCDGAIDEECVAPDAIVGGAEFTCALRRGAVVCWGAHDQGQLGARGARAAGTGTTVPIAGLDGPVSAVDAGREHVCVLLEDGRVACWGSTVDTRLGTRLASAVELEPVAVDVPASRELCVGDAHACVITRDGEAWCWGSNRTGAVDPSSGRAELAPGPIHDDTFEHVGCGDGMTCVSRGAHVECWGVVPGLRSYDAPEPIVQLAVGWAVVCVIDASARVRCAGDGTYAQVGDGTHETRAAFVELTALAGARDLELGWRHGCAVLGAGETLCWGSAGSGATGQSTELFEVLSPAPVTTLEPARAIAAGESHSCAIARSGAVLCFGSSVFGQSGAPALVDHFPPTRMRGI